MEDNLPVSWVGGVENGDLSIQFSEDQQNSGRFEPSKVKNFGIVPLMSQWDFHGTQLI